MMPPPETSLVPLSQRRPSSGLLNEAHSPPLRVLKQESIDENSQNSIMDPIELRHERYRHLSESSLDVHQGDSNISMINDNSVDLMQQTDSNMSLMNENSMEMISRRNRSVNPIEITNTLTNVTEDVRVATAVENKHLFPETNLLQPSILTAAPDDLKVIDLRMKIPMATVADLVNTKAPSLATLHSFGMMEPTNTPLPAQSAQSVENYLTNIENKQNEILKRTLTEKMNEIIHTEQQNALFAQKIIPATHLGMTSAPCVYISPSTTLQSEVINIVAKSEAAAIGGEQMSEQTITMAPSNTSRLTPETSVLPQPITAEKLDALVNCAVESHIRSPTTTISPVSTEHHSPKDILIGDRQTTDVLQNVLMVPPLLPTPQHIRNQSPPNITSEVILNSQISPTLMCRNSSTLPQETLLPSSLIQTNPLLPANQIPPSQLVTTSVPLTLTTVTEPEKVILLEAAADFLETQKKINEMTHSSAVINILNASPNAAPEIIAQPSSQLSQLTSPTGNNGFITNGGGGAGAAAISNMNAAQTLNEENGTIKEITNDKKNEDRMITQVFASMSENELINIINPSCFDQGNTFQ